MVDEKYEISLWDDELDTESATPYYKERKLAIIGSNTMTATCRAMEPQLIENVDGTNKFTFKMFYTCRDDSFDDLARDILSLSNSNQLYSVIRSIDFSSGTYKNPFLGFLTNERKVKVLWKGKWYDLLIKNCQEDSERKSITYTCTDLFINELSKTGFELQLDNELSNNQGTVTELGEIVLDGTDWTVDKANSDLLQQTQEEAVYEVVTSNGFSAINESEFVYTTVTINSNNRFDPSITYYRKVGDEYIIVPPPVADGTYYVRNHPSINIPANKTILVFYNQIQEIQASNETSGTSYIQFAYTTDSSYECAKGGQVVTNAICCSQTLNWEKTNTNSTTYGDQNRVDGQVTVDVADSIILKSGTTTVCTIITTQGHVSSRYRAERLVRVQRSIYDPLTKKYCDIYIASADNPNRPQDGSFAKGDIIYGYKEIQYHDPTTVNNLIVNNKNFTSTEGWVGEDLTIQLYPQYSAQQATTPKSYLKISQTTDQTRPLYNSGLRQLSNYIPDGLIEGKQYIIRYKLKESVVDASRGAHPGDYVINGNRFLPFVQTYTHDEQGNIIIPNDSIVYMGWASSDYSIYIDTTNHWIEWTFTCNHSASRASIYNDNIGIFFRSFGNYWLEEVEFFPLVYGTDINNAVVRINPGEMNITSIAATFYIYYNHTRSANLVSAENITYIWNNSQDLSADLQRVIKPIYNDDFEKIRNVNAKQSNRYNLLKTIAETFECWIQFIIEHNSDGSIVYENGSPKKYIRFKKENGQRTGIGFIYGIDLKTIRRTIQSDQIITKMIVSPNKNEFATNGFCTIARSKENFASVNFILNFDYYVSQNLIDAEALEVDLSNYYLLLNRFTGFYNKCVQDELGRRNDLLKQQSYVTLYAAAIESLQSQIASLRGELIRLAGVDSWEAAQPYIEANIENDEIASRLIAICSLENSLTEYNTSYNQLLNSVLGLQADINIAIAFQNSFLDLINQQHLAFYKKYSRYIQEGTWIDESYTNDDLYYLDALKRTRSSSRPQVSYDISVLRLSALEEFKNKVFHLGDISYIQDTEFFGYIEENGIKTPYREVVRISEITSNFDEPEKDTFKVQNYKTEFEDLFQRINSTSQSFHYSSGGYNRINSITNSDGSIKEKVLQDSINSSRISYNTTNEKIKQNSTGMVLSDVVDANKKTKITSGGVFVSQDGGVTWKNAVGERGVSTDLLTKGIINTRNINLMDGEHTSFRWDNNGINAYYTTPSSGIDDSRYVRFDYLGLYGIDGAAQPTSINDVWDDAKFGLTWDGFFMKNQYGTHNVEISNTNDIRIIDVSGNNSIEKIKIGRWNEGTEQSPLYKYGLRINDNDGNAVMKTTDDGKLWLKDSIITDGAIYTGEIYGSGDKDSLSVYGTENGVSFYTMQEVTPRLLQFNASVTYYEQDGARYIITSDTVPKNYYYQNNGGYTRLEVNSFSQGVVYYELINREYVETTDSEPKIYYTKQRNFYIDGHGLGIDEATLGEELNHYVIDKTNTGEVNGRFGTIYLGTRSANDNTLLVADNDSITQRICTGSTCAMGGNISFNYNNNANSTISLTPALRSSTIMEIKEGEVTITGTQNNNGTTLSIDVNNGTLTFDWKDSSNISHTAVLDLKSFEQSRV